MEQIIVNIFFRKNTAVFILACSALLLPHSVFASTVYIDTDHSEYFVGDTILFSVRVDSENKEINAVEGDVFLEDIGNAVALTDINTAGSLFSLWPGKPVPNDDNTSISFVGGSPGGFTSKDAVVFNIVLTLKQTGPVTLSPNNIGVYLNDGKGTKDTVRVKDLAINVLPETPDAPSADDWDTIIAKDKTAPEPFEIILGKDPSLFDNRYFVSFFTTDAASGVAYYEVQEGKRDFVRAESPYVLADQSLSDFVSVKAVDKAGNEKVVQFMPVAPTEASVPVSINLYYWIGAFILIVLAVASVLWKGVGRKK